ncbi:unnamed protein product, partial [Dicrocoelium dendriticum]
MVQRRQCCADNCSKLLKISITCSSCIRSYCPQCVGKSVQEVRQTNQVADTIWFCPTCQVIPVVNCLSLLMKKCDRMTEIIAQFVNTKIPPPEVNTATIISHPAKVSSESKPKKRARRSNRTAASVTLNPLGHLTPISGQASNIPASTSPTIEASLGDAPMTPTAQSRRKSGADNKQVTYASIASTNTPGGTHLGPFSVPSTRGAKQLSPPTPMVSSKQRELPTKSIKPTLTRQNHAALTLVCTNVPESKSGTIKGKLQDDRNQWSSICEAINIRVEPAMLQRVARHPTSVHSG